MAQMPHKGQITTQFGVVDPNAFFGIHSGIDIAANEGDAVESPAAGTVWFSGWSDTGGNMLILFDGELYHRLMHNESFADGIATGATITEGQIFGYAGATGLAFGPHVHWDIATEMLSALRPSKFSKFINPLEWLKKKGEEVGTITKDQDRMMSFLATGDEPGPGYDYRWVGQPTDPVTINMWLNFWREVQVYYGKNDKVTREEAIKYVTENLK